MNNDWSFHPGIGLGHLKFGMTPEEVQAFEGIYGKVTFEQKTTLPSERARKRWKEAMERQDQDTRKKWEEDDKILTDFRTKESEQSLKCGLRLSYYEKHLYSIYPFKNCEEFNVNGLPVFFSEPEAVVLALAGLLKENPLVKGSDLVFRKSLVYAFGFTYGISENGKPLYYTLKGTERDEGDTSFRERGIRWATLPRDIIPQDWSKHVEAKLL